MKDVKKLPTIAKGICTYRIVCMRWIEQINNDKFKLDR